MTALILIDVQKGFLSKKLGIRNNLNAEENMLKILKKFRENKKMIIHIQHISLSNDSPFFTKEGQEFKEGFKPLENEKVFQKNKNSAFIGTDLENYLHKYNINKLVIVGLTLPHCVSTTVRMAGNLGFDTIVVDDATASFTLKDLRGNDLAADEVHKYNLAAINHEFATVKSTEDILNNFKF